MVNPPETHNVELAHRCHRGAIPTHENPDVQPVSSVQCDRDDLLALTVSRHVHVDSLLCYLWRPQRFYSGAYTASRASPSAAQYVTTLPVFTATYSVYL